MEVIRLPAGKRADEESDCISIELLGDGRHLLNGSALLNCGDAESTESVALIGGEPYGSYEEAEAAGIAWASQHCVETLYVSRSEGTQPLPDIGD